MKKTILFLIAALFVFTGMGFAQTGTNAGATFYMTLDADAPTTAGTVGSNLLLWSALNTADTVYLRIYSDSLISTYAYNFTIGWNTTEFDILSVSASNSTYETNILGTPGTWLTTGTPRNVLAVISSGTSTSNGLMAIASFKRASGGTGAGNAVFTLSNVEIKESSTVAAVSWPENVYGNTAVAIAAVQDAGPIIPVELAAFTVTTVSTNDMRLEWSTASETNNYGFEIERSTDGESFNKLGFVKGNGTTAEMHRYSYVDESLNSGQYYYRLKQIDFNGSYSYSAVVKSEVQTPDEYGLDQNYPNPFNPVTTIPYRIKDAGKVQLKVYNILGQEVATIIDKDIQPGYYRATFNGSRLASGMYFYRMTVNGNALLKKFVLVK